jgi:N-hydroxyarylamine O-acetyltransferase
LPFALPAYLARIGIDAAPTPDLAGLETLHRAHRLAIPFENLDIPLGMGIIIDPDAVFAKLVTRRRGGYCFEQNRLFLAALDALGFSARPLLARVWLLADATPPLTHTFSLVTIDGEEWIADAGFGGSFSPPMPLTDGAAFTAADGTTHRLTSGTPHGWMLDRAGDPAATDGRSTDTRDWQPQYSFTLGQVEPIDLELSNHWASTRAGTRFTTLTLASRVLPNGFASLLDARLTLHRDGESRVLLLTDAIAYRAALADHFGLELTREEVDRLRLFER